MAINPIKVLKDVVEGAAHTITIDSVVSLGGSKYQLMTENTLYLRTAGEPKTITIDAVDYTITDFEINSYITVKAVSGDIAVTASSFTINAPLFVWGNPQMVSAELLKRVNNNTVIWPYIWVVEISNTQNTLDPAAAVRTTPSFNIFFLNSADKVNWTIEEHYDEDIYTLNNYIEFFIEILKSRRDLFATTLITYTTVNHVNFGDYIVDEGMKELILNGGITGIQMQIDIPYTIDTCNDIVVTSKCNGASETLNGTAISPLTDGSTKAIIVQNDLPSPVQVGAILTDTPTSLIVSVPAAGVPAGAIAYSRPKNDVMISYNNFDEGYQFINTTDTYVLPLNAVQNSIDPSDVYKIILDERAVGHLFRYQGLNDGYYNSDDDTYRLANGDLSDRGTVFDNDSYALDRFTGLAYITVRGGSKSLQNSLIDADAKTWQTFTDWNLPTDSQHKSIISRNLGLPTYSVDSKVFNIQLQKWSCTPFATTPTLRGWSRGVNGQSVQNRAYTSVDVVSYVRYALF